MKIRNTNTFISLILFGFLLIPAETEAQSVNAYFDYTGALSMRDGVQEAAAYGGGVRLDLFNFGNVVLSFNSGFKLFDVDQPGIIDKWGWRFWDARYKDRVEADLQANPDLSAEISYEESIEVLPVMLNVGYDLNLIDALTVFPYAGGGVYFYTRTLHIIEDWTKRFPDADYTFSYSYRNFAPDKKGNPIVGTAGMEIMFRISEGFKLFAGGSYLKVFDTGGDFGYENYPLNSELSLKFGLTILY